MTAEKLDHYYDLATSATSSTSTYGCSIISPTPSVDFSLNLATKSDLDEINKKLIELSNKIKEKEEKNLVTKSDLDEINKKFIELSNKIKEKEENKKMNLKLNLDFGPVAENSSVRVSTLGLAVCNREGTYVSYDPAKEEIVNVDILTFDNASKFLYKMPVAISDVVPGDIVIHQRAPMFITEIAEDKKVFIAIDPIAGERKVIMPTKSPFGFNFMTKIVNFFGNFGDMASSDNPFGSLLPLMLMSESGNKNDNLLPLMFMMNNNKIDFNANPMMMYALMNHNESVDPLFLMFMMNNNHKYNCECANKDNQ